MIKQKMNFDASATEVKPRKEVVSDIYTHVFISPPRTKKKITAFTGIK